MKPVASGERYLTLDVLRGLSLLGVLLVNDLGCFRVSLFEQMLAFHTHPGWGNRLVDVLVPAWWNSKRLLSFRSYSAWGSASKPSALALAMWAPATFSLASQGWATGDSQW
jgi:hypothetical protein